MKVSACCFNDFELKQFIDASATEVGVCEYCSDANEVKLVDVIELSDFF